MNLLAKLIALFACIDAFAQPVVYPPTKAVDELISAHGVSVPDPYRWLENIDDPQVKEWRAKQNDFAMKFLGDPSTRSKVSKRLQEIGAVASESLPVVNADRYVWLQRVPNMEYSVLKISDADSKSESTLVNPNTIEPGLSIASFNVSPDGGMVAYRTRKNGTQGFSLRIKSIDSGENFPEVLTVSSVSSSSGIGWSKDNRGFYYVRKVTSESTANNASTLNYDAIYFHRIGTSQNDDVHVWGNAATAQVRYSAKTYPDGNYLFVRTWEKSALSNGFIVIPLNDSVPSLEKVTRIATDFKSSNYSMGMHDGRLIILTNADSPNYRIVEVDLSNPVQSNWKTIIAETASVLDDAIFMNDQYFALYMEHAASKAVIYNVDGKQISNAVLPGIGSVGNMMPDQRNGRILFSYSSLNQPPSLYYFDMRTFKSSTYKASSVPFNATPYEVSREFVTARDGTKVPVFLAYKKGLRRDGSNPFILHGYGGFKVSMQPKFGTREAVWLEMGGSIALASVRGGGEYGETWYKAGSLLNKKNSINDFVDVAGWLVKQRYTNPKKLAIAGASNGGLLVSAAANAKPELFASVLNAFGLTDMLRYESSKTGFDWTDEFGTVKNELQFKNLLSYSPQSNIVSNRDYPAILALSAELDDRVLPWHQSKYIAALQTSNTGPSPKLLRVYSKTGHGFGTSVSTEVEQQTDQLLFFATTLGIAIK